ncbi:MAG: hypothetical protein ACO1SX_02490 [Actinomycetota bacterium]
MGRLWGEVTLPWAGPEVWREFADLYHTEVGNERLYDAGLSDAAAFVGFFTSALRQLDQPVQAEVELQRFFARPDLAELESRTRMDLRCRLGFCTLAQGRETEALQLFRGLWSTGPEDDRRYAVMITRHFLSEYLRGAGMASEDMTGFVEELIALWKQRPPRRSRFPARTTYRNLRRHLRRSYPKVKRVPGDEIDALAELIGKRAHGFIRSVTKARQQAAAERKRTALGLAPLAPASAPLEHFEHSGDLN